MLLMPDKKKIATLIVSRSKPDFVQKMGEKTDRGELDMDKVAAETEYGIGLTAAAEKIMLAVDEKKPELLVKALKEFVQMCSYEGDDD